MSHCPKPYHCPHVNDDGTVCNSHPQLDMTARVYERDSECIVLTNKIRLCCYFGHWWTEKDKRIPVADW
jgi:hypothetical protein